MFCSALRAARRVRAARCACPHTVFFGDELSFRRSLVWLSRELKTISAVEESKHWPAFLLPGSMTWTEET